MSDKNLSSTNETINQSVDTSISNAIQLVSGKEPTTELQIYWQQRFEEIVKDRLFTISAQTLQLLDENRLIDKPTTPIGSINIIKHLDGNNNVKEYELQNTIEAVVRLLDGFLEVINFAPGARNLVSEYRKIGVSLENLTEYLDLHRDQKPEAVVDTLGSLISNCCYRASESVAEEKGHCLKWDQIKQQIRPKSFEYWYNTETGEIKNGLEISQSFNQQSIRDSNFEIVPRRNSHILLYPSDELWQKWSDRLTGKTNAKQPASNQAKNLPKKEKNKTNEPVTDNAAQSLVTGDSLPESIFSAVPQSILPNLMQTTPSSNISSPTDLMPDMIPLEDVLPGILGSMTPDSPDQIKKVFESAEHSSDVIEVAPSATQNDGDTVIDIDRLSEKTEILPTSEGQGLESFQQDLQPADLQTSTQSDQLDNSILTTDSPDISDTTVLSQESDRSLPSKTDLDQEIINSSLGINPVLDNQIEAFTDETTYQIGEIIRVTNSGRYYQIINTIKENGSISYQLTDNDQGVVVQTSFENLIEPASLEVILGTVNQGNSLQKKGLKSRLIIFNSLGQIGLTQTLERPLPEFDLNTTEKIENQIQTYLQQEYDIISGDIEEVGVFIDQSDFALVYYVQIPDQTQSLKGVNFVELDQAMERVTQLNSYLEKLSKQEILIQKRLTGKEREIEELKKQLSSLRSKVQSLGVDLQSLGYDNRAIQQNRNDLSKPFQSAFSQKYLYDKDGLRMTKFLVYLEQLLNIDKLGKLMIRVQYDGFGVKDVTVEYLDDSVSPTNRNIIKTYISLANTSLGGGTGLHDMALVLEQQSDPQFDFGSKDINKVLYGISQALYSMPPSLDLLDLKNLAVTSLPDIMEAKKSEVPVLQIVLNK